MNGYIFKGKKFEYIKQMTPNPIDKYRKCELPLLKQAIDEYSKDPNFIEVGAVSNWYLFPYGKWKHKIYDATELFVINELAENLDYNDKIVVSISTVEHIGKDYEHAASKDGKVHIKYGAYSIYRSITVLNKMLESCKFLITFTQMYNLMFDEYVFNIIRKQTPEILFSFKVDENDNWECDKEFRINDGGICVITNMFGD